MNWCEFNRPNSPKTRHSKAEMVCKTPVVILGNYIPMHILERKTLDISPDLVYTKYINQRVVKGGFDGKKRSWKALPQGYHTHRGC